MSDQSSQVDKSFAVVTMSDKGSRGERDDTSGAYLQEELQGAGFVLKDYRVIPDVQETIINHLEDLADNLQVALIVTTGGTGLSPTDVTPEAMLEVLDKEVPGISEAMRQASLAKTSRAMLSRGKSGIRKNSLIINFPGSLKAVQENLEVVMDVLPHALEKLQGGKADCGQV